MGQKRAVAQSEALDLAPEVARSPLSELVGQLQEILTQKLTAYIVGLSDGRDIGRYAREERKPHFETQIKLRDLFSLVVGMSHKEDSETIQVWFMGRNPELADKSPASLLRQNFDRNFDRVKNAARKFLEMGT